MSEWTDAFEARAEAWRQYTMTIRGTEAHRAAAVAYAAACARLDELDSRLEATQ